MNTPDLKEGSTETGLYALVGAVVVIGALIVGVAYLASKSQTNRSASITEDTTIAEQAVIMAEMKNHLGTWQTPVDKTVHHVKREQLTLPANIHLVEVAYGYCDADHFYAYAVTSMQGTFETGAYGTVLAYTTTQNWRDKCGPETWLTYPMTSLGDGWFEARFAIAGTPTKAAQ
jgi:Flp pilus assembly protein TadB